MENLLPLGSVVKARDLKLMILGDIDQAENGKMRTYYIAVQYPRGFATLASLGMIEPEEIQEVLFTGYIEEGKEGYFKAKKSMHEKLYGMSEEDAKKAMEDSSAEWIQVMKERMK